MIMVTIKRKVTIKTKIALEEPHTAIKSHEVTPQREQSEQEFASTNAATTPTPKPEKKPNTNKIIGGIVATAAILIGVYFFAFKGNGDDANVGTTTEQTSQVGKTSAAENAENAMGTNAGEQSTTDQAKTEEPSDRNNTPTATEKADAPTTANVDNKRAGSSSANEVPPASQANSSLAKHTTMQETSTPVNGNIEENARKVIRGDFGNGQTRKDKLGSSYAEIQGKVNEMYRQGLVH